MSDFDDESTPPKGKLMRPLTDSEREVFRAKYESGVPVVNGDYEHEDTSPIDLFRREPKRSQNLVTELRRHPEKLIPFLGEFAEWVHEKMRERSSSEQSAMTELRELLSKPPNGATQRLQEQVTGLEQAIGELAERMEEVEKFSGRLEPIEGTIKGVKGFSRWAISGLITAVLGSAVGIIATLQAKAEKDGALAERILTIQRDIIELKARLNSRQQRQDYDYDIAPRPAPLKKD